MLERDLEGMEIRMFRKHKKRVGVSHYCSLHNCWLFQWPMYYHVLHSLRDLRISDSSLVDYLYATISKPDTSRSKTQTYQSEILRSSV